MSAEDVARGPWVQLKSGKPLDLLTLTVEQAREAVPDLISSICTLPRFNGHTVGDVPWTVGQHSLLVARLLERWGAPPEVVREGLFHDLPEGVYGDWTSPVQRALAQMARDAGYVDVFAAFRANIDAKVRAAVNLPFDEHPLVRRADLVALAIERRDLMAKCERDWLLPEYAPTDFYIRPGEYGSTAESTRYLITDKLSRLPVLDAQPEAAS